MNELERYLFDLQGFLAVPEALDAAAIESLNTILDEHIAVETDAEMQTRRFGGLLKWGAAYRKLIDNPAIVPYLETLLGPKFRLDHDYLDVIRSGLGPIGATLHGGGTPFDPVQYYAYRDGKMYNGLMVVAYSLKTVNPGDGGFACVPGSHKSNFPFPHEWRNLDQLQPCVLPVTGAAGTAIIFTEALTHGTLPWRGQDERRTIFLKYSPHPLSYSARYYNAADYDDLAERQRRILEPPNARYQKY